MKKQTGKKSQTTTRRHPITEADVFHALECAKSEGILQYTLVLFMYAVGLRQNELCSLRISDIDMEKRIVHVHAKRKGIERNIPLICHDAVVKYMEYRKAMPANDDRLFVTDNVKPITIHHLHKILFTICIKSGVNITAYSMRHSFASHMNESGASISLIFNLLGYSTPSPIPRITPITLNELRECMSNHHPYAKRMKIEGEQHLKKASKKHDLSVASRKMKGRNRSKSGLAQTHGEIGSRPTGKNESGSSLPFIANDEQKEKTSAS